MPGFADLKETQISAIVAFLHNQVYAALHSANVPGDYPLAKLLTGDAARGKAYFNGEGGCAGCHSPTGNLAGVAKKYSPVDLQQRLVYPDVEDKSTATITTSDGTTFHGGLKHADEFTIAIISEDGWYRSWPLEKVKVKINDPLAAHRALTEKYTDANMHDLFAYLETLK
jgi:cytochrome c oxidase cbb3-type subunit 3